MKDVYAIQPYQVGSKHGRSLAIVIPAKVAKKYNIDTSTIFALRGDENTRTVSLQMVRGSNQFIETPAGESLEASVQQVGAQ